MYTQHNATYISYSYSGTDSTMWPQISAHTKLVSIYDRGWRGESVAVATLGVAPLPIVVALATSTHISATLCGGETMESQDKNRILCTAATCIYVYTYVPQMPCWCA